MGPTRGALSLGGRISEFFQGLLPGRKLGDTWEDKEAANAYQAGTLHSQGGGKAIRIAFRNLSSVPLLLCWVSENGDLNHFYKLPPASGMLGFSETTVTEGDHIEHTFGGHAFCVAYLPPDQVAEAQRLESLQDTTAIIGGYCPNTSCKGDQVHLVTISRAVVSEEVGCCQALRGGTWRKRRIQAFESEDSADDEEEKSKNKVWSVSATLADIDPTPWDSSTKVYELKMLGGWPVYAEPNWHGGDFFLERRLAGDLRDAASILPKHAVEYLRGNCPIWVNSSIKFGPKVCPVEGQGCCYHPDKHWLIDNGLSPLKHKCIEINCGPGYKKDLDLWGGGGVLVHELSHAYHHRMLPDGYENKEILACFNAAMEEGLYNSVKVHGPQGPEAKAYACTNDKEYFAELSTAFLGAKMGGRNTINGILLTGSNLRSMTLGRTRCCAVSGS